MSQAESRDLESLWALRHHVTESGRLLMIELDHQGLILDANAAFRSRFAGFSRVTGESLWRFLHSGPEAQDLVAHLLPQTPVALVLKESGTNEAYLFHAYRVEQGALLIGEVAAAADDEIVERMGHLAIQMSRLVRDLHKANHALALANDLNRELARTDPLTGLANRRYFMERLSTDIQHARSRQHSLSVIMIDLDHFKRFNDQFGHEGGDAVLVAVANLLRSLVRTADLPGRLGGEEFVVSMLDADLRAAHDAAERIRRGVAQLRPIDPESRITASLGVAELADGEGPENLLKRADGLLYCAKAMGRNRVVARSITCESAQAADKSTR